MSIPSRSSIKFSVSLIIVKFLRPRKSNFNKPNSSRSDASNCVWYAPINPGCIGEYSLMSSPEIIIPAACVDTCLTKPFIFSAVSIKSLIWGILTKYEYSLLNFFLNVSTELSALVKVLESSSMITESISRIRPTSLTADFPWKVPKVMIETTLSFPYLSITYLITSSRLSSGKSISISGMDILSGFRNLSKYKSFSIGSTSTIPKT